MIHDEIYPTEKASEEIELQTVLEQNSPEKLNISIEYLRAKRLSPEGRDALHKSLSALADQIMTEGTKILSITEKDPFSLISAKHIDLGVTTVVEKLSIHAGKKTKWLSAVENLATGAMITSVPLVVENHLYSALGCAGFGAIVYWLMNFFGGE